ncbi:MAG: hypothetical protein Q4B63_06440 [Clostridium perfringens]|nr:hypothetical protein [Clostridium perfringens]
MSIIVKTKEELKKAMDLKYPEIIAKGDLAKKLKQSKSITKLSSKALKILTVAAGAGVLAAPLTGGTSLGVSLASLVPISALTGIEVAAIVASSFLGIALIIAVFKEYEEIEYSRGKLVLRKKVTK